MYENFIVVPQAQHEGRWHWKLNDNLAELTLLALLIVLIEDLEVVARHRLRDGASQSWEHWTIGLSIEQIRADRP